MIKLFYTAFLLSLFLLLSACGNSSESVDFRENEAITLGISWPSHNGYFIEGAKLAVKEANAAGGVLNRPIELIIDEREQIIVEQLQKSSSLTIGENIKEYSRQIARDLSHDPRNVVAVIGHSYSFLAFSAANIYQQNNKVYVAPVSTNMLLTSLDYNNVFRMLPTNIMLGQQLADYSHKQGYKKIAIFNERSEYALELSIAIAQNAAQRHNIKTLVHDSFFANMSSRDYSAYAIQFRKQQLEEPVDAIFVISGSKIALNIFREFKKRGISDIPFIGGESLDRTHFWDAISEWQEKSNQPANFTVPTIFKLGTSNTRSFEDRFKFEYDDEPDRLAALGFDSVNSVVRGIRQAQSSEPTKVADEMHYMGQCEGISGPVKFAENGDALEKIYTMKTLDRYGYSYRDLDGNVLEDIPKDQVLTRCIDYDHDADGIINKQDQCPDSTPAELSMGIYQDGETKGCPVDSDFDGVPDYRDEIPDNELDQLTRGVDELGQPVDSDNDLIPDYRDISPKDPTESLVKGVSKKGLPKDTDKDDIPDYRDDCPKNSKFELSKGRDEQGCPFDSDNDLVFDFEDKCPNDTQKMLSKGMDSRGCPVDTDADGFADYKDKCPTDSAYHVRAGVDIRGCPIDRDRDGVPDYSDQCPDNSPIEISFATDAKGCPFDLDGDGIPDFKDTCPADTEMEVSAGIDEKGCPLDSDKDTILDVFDECRSTDLKAIGGTVDKKGCPIDTDKDGIANYLDACPKSSPLLKIDKNGCASVEVMQFMLFDMFEESSSQFTNTSEEGLWQYVSTRMFHVEIIESIEIIFYSDDMTLTEDGELLSELQLDAVVQFFIQQGANPSLIQAVVKAEKANANLDEDSKQLEVRIRGVVKSE